MKIEVYSYGQCIFSEVCTDYAITDKLFAYNRAITFYLKNGETKTVVVPRNALAVTIEPIKAKKAKKSKEPTKAKEIIKAQETKKTTKSKEPIKCKWKPWIATCVLSVVILGIGMVGILDVV